MALLKKTDSAKAVNIPPLPAATPSSKKKNRGRKVDSILDLDEVKARTTRSDKTSGEVAETTFPSPLSEIVEEAVFNAAIAKAAADIGLKKGSAVAMDLPRSAAVLRQITIPFVSDANEMNSMVHFQISRDLPFKAEDAIIDFQFQREIAAPAASEPEKDSDPKEKSAEPTAEARKLEALVAAVKTDVLKRYQSAAEAAGLKITQFGLRSHSNLRALAENHKTSENEAICLISLRWDEIVIEVGTGTVLAVSRVVLTAPEIVRRLRPKESPASDPATEIISLVNTEVIRTFHAYEGMAWQKPIKEVVIAGELGIETALLAKLKTRLTVPCSLLSTEEGAQLALTGLRLLTLENSPIDFINPKKPKVVVDRKKLKMFGALAACVALLFVLFGVRSNLVNKRLKVKLAAQAELTEAEKKLPVYRRMRQQIIAVRGWAKTSPTWLDHYAYLSSILPAATELYVSSITSSSAGTLRLAVQARTGEILADMEKRFRAAGYSVKPLSITPGSDKYGYNFRTTVELVIPAKFKIDVKKLEAPPRPEDDTPPATAETTTSRKNAIVAQRP